MKKTYICVELSSEACEIVMFEVGWKENIREFLEIPYDKTVVATAPRNNHIC